MAHHGRDHLAPGQRHDVISSGRLGPPALALPITHTCRPAAGTRFRVATETVCVVVGTKPELFRLLTETAISGTDELVPVLQRDYIQALRAEPSGRGKLEIYAAGIVWAVNSTEVYQLMTQTRGWSPQHYQQWLTSTLCMLLLADSG